MKKGFTLIELLAVIVILAIIALIATPIVLNIINDTKESANFRSAEFYINAVENAIANKLLNDPSFKIEDGSYSIMSDGNICVNGEFNLYSTCEKEDSYTGEIKIEVSGETPNTGRIRFKDGKIVEFNLIYGTNIVNKERLEPELVFKRLKSTLKNGILYGDANGDGLVTYVDAELVINYNANWDIDWNTEINLDAADVDCDGNVDGWDVTMIRQYLDGWDVTLGSSE